MTKRSATNVRKFHFENYLVSKGVCKSSPLRSIRTYNTGFYILSISVRVVTQFVCDWFIKWPIIRSYFRKAFEHLHVVNYTPCFHTKICTQRKWFIGNNNFAYYNDSTPFSYHETAFAQKRNSHQHKMIATKTVIAIYITS